VAARRCTAFAPGRVNVIGEHTDYNEGLALPFAIEQGVTVRALALEGEEASRQVEALALDLGERDTFALSDPGPAEGWRAFVHGAVAELAAAGQPLHGARLEISGGVPQGGGLSSSAALTVALCLALLELGAGKGLGDGGELRDRPVELARLCARVENEWTGAHTGLLDQLASLCGARDAALLIDFRTLVVERVPLALGGWRFVTADSGQRHSHASSGYNERRQECARACELLGIRSLRDADAEQAGRLPEPLRSRARHVIEENERVVAADAALRERDMPELARLINASHASLRDLYDVSTPAVEATVRRLLDAGAAGARPIGGGFGGAVLGLFAPGTEPPAEVIAVAPGPGAHLLEP
jgi:galactokinase